MNKYKEALKAFDIEEKSSNCDKCPATIYNHCQYGENGMPFENNCLAYKLIQELVDKETPKEPRAEEEVLKDFSKIGYKVVTNNNSVIVLYNKKRDTRIFIYKKIKRVSFHDRMTLSEHKLLHELFQIWNWLYRRRNK